MSKPWRAALAAFLLAAMLQGRPAGAADSLGGEYQGVDAAQGVSVSVAPGAQGGYSVSIKGLDKKTYDVSALAQGAGAEGELTWEGGAGIFRLVPKPVGLIMVFLPYGENKTPQVSGARSFAFVRAGTELPALPKERADPPAPGEKPDSIVFLHNYEFWEAADVGRVYAGLPEKEQTMIRLFPLVQADVLWKLCKAGAQPQGLGEALRGQGVTCPDVVAGLAASQRNGRFSGFKRDMAAQKFDLIRALECGRGMHWTQHCAAAAKATQAAAMSMQTVGGVIQGLK